VISKYLQGASPVDNASGRPRRLGRSIDIGRLTITPNPVGSGGAMEVAITLSAIEPVKIGEVAVLFYSSLETRVAVIDLRAANLPAAARRGLRMDRPRDDREPEFRRRRLSRWPVRQQQRLCGRRPGSRRPYRPRARPRHGGAICGRLPRLRRARRAHSRLSR
jgi:hypothetical protein